MKKIVFESCRKRSSKCELCLVCVGLDYVYIVC